MNRLHGVIERVARSDRPVLVNGPTGSGKELVVGAIHAMSARRGQPLFDLNCGAISPALIESQLFGHERGAFTGADRRREGYLSAVGEGTLFLDEIAELPLLLQSKLLRVIETGRFRAVGATVESKLAGRIVAATHADLAARVSAGAFREDLYFRLNVLTVKVPSLAERPSDIPDLIAYFAAQHPKPPRFSRAAIDVLCARDWPGNVRELRNLVERAAVFCDDEEITPGTLSKVDALAETPSIAPALQGHARAILQLPLGNKLAAIESALVNEAMALAGSNKSSAARLLGVHRKVLERRVARPDS